VYGCNSLPCKNVVYERISENLYSMTEKTSKWRPYHAPSESLTQKKFDGIFPDRDKNIGKSKKDQKKGQVLRNTNTV